MGSQTRSPRAGRVAEKRQAALAVIADGTIRTIHIVKNLLPVGRPGLPIRPRQSDSSTVRFSIVGLAYLQRSCIRTAMATQNVGYAAARWDTGGQPTNAVAWHAADDGAIQALSFSKPSARGISGTKRAVVQMQNGHSDTQHTLRKAASPLDPRRGPLASWGRATTSRPPSSLSVSPSHPQPGCPTRLEIETVEIEPMLVLRHSTSIVPLTLCMYKYWHPGRQLQPTTRSPRRLPA